MQEYYPFVQVTVNGDFQLLFSLLTMKANYAMLTNRGNAVAGVSDCGGCICWALSIFCSLVSRAINGN